MNWIYEVKYARIPVSVWRKHGKTAKKTAGKRIDICMITPVQQSRFLKGLSGNSFSEIP